jgi:hypothetical protein
MKRRRSKTGTREGQRRRRASFGLLPEGGGFLPIRGREETEAGASETYRPRPRPVKSKKLTDRDLLQSLVEFAKGFHDTPEAADAYIDAFIDRVAGTFVNKERDVDINGLRGQVREALTAIAEGKPVRMDPRAFRNPRASVFLAAMGSLLRLPAARFVCLCLGPKCTSGRLFIRRTQGRYCSPRCALDAKLEQRRQIPVKKRQARRRTAYLKELEKKSPQGKAAAQHVRAREKEKERE